VVADETAQENTKYVRTACLLMEVLLSCKEGTDWLNSCGLLPQIARILNIELEKVTLSLLSLSWFCSTGG
jgi:hypothetical protein